MKLRKELDTKLETYCRLTGKTKREVLHQALEEFLQKEFKRLQQLLNNIPHSQKQ